MDDYAEVSYRERASLYAAEYCDTVDFAFLRSFVTADVRTILEVPSGVGRNVLNMATTGCSIVAVDREPEMVRFLLERVRQERPRSTIRAVTGDLTGLDLGLLFDLVVVPREAFQLLTARDAPFEALSGLRTHLAQQGLLIIDLSPFWHSPDADMPLRPDYYDPQLAEETWHFDWERRAERGIRFTREHLQRRESADRLEIQFRYQVVEEGGRSYRTKTSTRFAIYTQADFEALVRAAGLQIKACYGDYDFKPYEEGDARMIFCLALPDEHQPGSSQKLSQGFVNDRHAFRIADWATVAIRPEILKYFQGYMDAYFNGPFMEGQGAEQILSLMHRFAVPGTALDLGAGTSTLFWYAPVTGLTSVTCADIAPEPLLILKSFVEGTDVPECYEWSIERFGLDRNHLACVRAAIGDYVVFDSLSRWPALLDDGSFDLITAFGNVAISADRAQYCHVFQEIARHLRPGGRTIGADWIRRPVFRSASGHDNSYLDLDLVCSAIAGAGLELIECRQICIEGDPFYDGIIYWAAERMQPTEQRGATDGSHDG